MKRLLFFIVPLLVALPLPAQGPAVGDNRTALMQQRREKLREKWEAQFRAADTDNSGSLSRDEVRKAGMPAAILDHFDDIDTNHDGQLTPEELMAAYEKRLDAQKGAPKAIDHSF
jgi:Ca2+-binding EF-hand superfamily protein